jgi:apolipoprotein N-acyltransferase
MINAGFVDFLFTGVAIVPQLLLFTGYIGPALLLFILLLIAACLISMYREKTTGKKEKTEDSTAELELPLTTAGQ